MDAIRDDDAQRVASPRRRFGGQPVAGLAALAAVLVVISGLLFWNIQLRSELAHQNAFVITLSGDSGASGWMFYDDSQESGVIGVEGLAPLPSGQTYQVWASTPRGPRSCGLLPVASPTLAFARMTGEVSPGQTVFVTVEPAGGSTVPSGTTVLSGGR
jgi:anti-sigma-K factor RskA